MNLITKIGFALVISTLSSGLAFAQSKAPATATASTPATQSPVASSSKFAVQYGYCFADGQGAVYDKNTALGVEDCRRRCEADAKCAVFEIWEHTLICKLYSKLPLAPRPQSAFPNNKTARGEQAQAAIGIKVQRGF